MTAPDPARVRRALYLDVVQLDDGTWRVEGGASAHRLVPVDHGTRCDCPDFQLRGGPCKHQVALRLARLGPGLLAALRELVPPESAATWRPC